MGPVLIAVALLQRVKVAPRDQQQDGERNRRDTDHQRTPERDPNGGRCLLPRRHQSYRRWDASRVTHCPTPHRNGVTKCPTGPSQANGARERNGVAVSGSVGRASDDGNVTTRLPRQTRRRAALLQQTRRRTHWRRTQRGTQPLREQSSRQRSYGVSGLTVIVTAARRPLIPP